ncbi:hypothetical protein D9757_014259 [Collybiopsis confluens]|uniref:WSC domain-containing protein n=1 Tax=Collybiopsis confluens TaxID=2823264 RepID=A0A8H5CI79_9AGAR|nr:hypothetical protein D9757_014259 [Collybiopsis confluens]
MAVGRVKLQMVKSSKTVIDASPAEFEVVATPSKYNYNVYVGAETAIMVGPTPPTAISVSIPISISIPFFGTSPSSTSTPIRPTSSSLSTSGSTPSVITTTVSVVPSSTASAYLSIGCVAEGTTGSRRALTGSSYSDKAMTPAKCLTFCRGYKYAGTEYGTQCFCGNSLQNNGATGLIKGSGYCNYRCAGDSSQSCGGSYFLSVYSTSMSTLPAPGSFKSLGCVAEGTTGARRALTGTSYADSAMTPAICQSLCVGYKYAGTEYGSECKLDEISADIGVFNGCASGYCGDTFTNNGASGIIVASSNCNSKCSGDTSQFCGGSYFLSLYQNSV